MNTAFHVYTRQPFCWSLLPEDDCEEKLNGEDDDDGLSWCWLLLKGEEVPEEAEKTDWFSPLLLLLSWRCVTWDVCLRPDHSPLIVLPTDLISWSFFLDSLSELIVVLFSALMWMTIFLWLTVPNLISRNCVKLGVSDCLQLRLTEDETLFPATLSSGDTHYLSFVRQTKWGQERKCKGRNLRKEKQTVWRRVWERERGCANMLMCDREWEIKLMIMMMQGSRGREVLSLVVMMTNWTWVWLKWDYYNSKGGGGWRCAEDLGRAEHTPLWSVAAAGGGVGGSSDDTVAHLNELFRTWGDALMVKR